MNLVSALRAIFSGGFSLPSQTLRYSVYKTLLDRPARRDEKTLKAANPGALVEARPIPSGARFRFTRAELEIVFLAPDLARISWEPGLPPRPYALARIDWPAVQVDLHQDTTPATLSSTQLRIAISPDGSLDFHDPSGRLLRHEFPPECLTSGKNQAGWRQSAGLDPAEKLFGLGERAAGLNLRGGTYRFWNVDAGGAYPPGKDPLYMSIPVYISLHPAGSYLIFYENSFPGWASFSSTPGSSSQVEFEDGMLRSYFIPGPPQRLLERYSELTGRPPLPPRWALGYHQSRWGYKNSADLRQVMAGFKEHDLPLDALYLDIDYLDGYRIFTIDRQRFPDLKAIAAELHQQGAHLVTIIDAGVKKDPGYFLYQNGIKGDWFCKLPNGKLMSGPVWPGESVFADFTDPRVRQAWGEEYAFLLDQGVDGIWHDMNEPTAFSARGDMTLPLLTRHDLDGRPGDHRQAHNYYGLLMNQAGFEGLRRLSPERRPWILSRSGYAGIQRFAWSWTGDTETSWETLKNSISTVLGLSLSGVPFSGPDVGGYSGGPSAELYIRWLQLGAFLPFFRTHSALGTPPREPWTFGEPTTSMAHQVLKNRRRLLPYLYTSAWQTCQTGIPMARPLFWADPSDERLQIVDDAYFLGEDLLVAPVLQEGARDRQLMLPTGEWLSLWDDTRLSGPGQASLTGPLERIPVLVRGGSLLPMEEGGILELHAYPVPGEYKSLVYSDAGDGYGPSRLDQYTLTLAEDVLQVHCETQGDYKDSFMKLRFVLHRNGMQPGEIREALVDGTPVMVMHDQFVCPPFKDLKLRLNPAG